MQRIHIIFVFFSVLEARIQQLQSDVVLDAQHAKVHFVKVPSCRRGVSSDNNTIRALPQGKTDIPKYGLLKASSKPQPSRWMEKLSLEKKSKIKKLQHVRQKFQKSVKETLKVKTKGNKSSLMATSTKHKATSSASERRGMKPSDSSPTTVSAVTAEKSAASDKVSKKKWKILKAKSLEKDLKAIEAKNEELREIEELDKILNQQKLHRTLLGAPESTEDMNLSPCGDIQLNILSYLEACVFMGDNERSQNFLLSQHRTISRRKHLTTDIYNIMMKVWAKKVSDEIKINETVQFFFSLVHKLIFPTSVELKCV